MDPRRPIDPPVIVPGFGYAPHRVLDPIDGAALAAEKNRAAVGAAFRCVAAQIAIALAISVVAGFVLMISMQRIAVYEAQLAACAGV